MKIELTTRVVKDGKFVEEPIEFEIDTSLAAQIRYETKFPLLAQQEDIYHYSKRVCEYKTLSAEKILSELKLLYCWMTTDIEFMDFVKLFDFTNEKFVIRFTKEVKNAFDVILNSSAEKN